MDPKICEPHGTRQKPPTIDLLEDLKNIVDAAQTFDSDDYFKLVMELLNKGPFERDQLLSLKNHCQNLMKKKMKSAVKDCGSGTSELPCKADSSVTVPNSSAAFRSANLIYRGDLIDMAEEIYIDVEKVIQIDTHKTLPSSIAVVDKNWRLLVWAIIRQENVCKYNAALTGIDRSKMEAGVQPLLKQCFNNKKLIGLAIENDLLTLDITHPDTIDLQHFFRDSKNQAISAEDLGIHFLGKNMQEDLNGKPHHTAIRDARITVLCHKKMQYYLQAYPTKRRFECPDLDLYRENRPSRKDSKAKVKWDKCAVGCALREKMTKGKPKAKLCKNMLGGFDKMNFNDFEFGGSSKMVEENENDWE